MISLWSPCCVPSLPSSLASTAQYLLRWQVLRGAAGKRQVRVPAEWTCLFGSCDFVGKFWPGWLVPGRPSSLVSPKRVVWCRVGSRYFEGWWDSLTWKSRNIGFGILKFHGSKIVWFQSYWFPGFNISKTQWSHITKFTFYVLRNILIPYSGFSKIIGLY